MDYMELQFPGDIRDEQRAQGRNISDAERWLSMAAGIGLAAYGASRRKASGWALAGLGGLLFRRGCTAHCDVYEMFGINTAGTGQDTRRALGGSAGIIVEESVTINRSASELYRFWRNLENLPRFMSHLESVERITDTLSRWRAKGPGGNERRVERRDHQRGPGPGHRLAIDRRLGRRQCRFRQLRRGRARTRHTRSRAAAVQPAGRQGGRDVARLMGRDPATEIREDLRRFKQLIEAGEVATNER